MVSPYTAAPTCTQLTSGIASIAETSRLAVLEIVEQEVAQAGPTNVGSQVVLQVGSNKDHNATLLRCCVNAVPTR